MRTYFMSVTSFILSVLFLKDCGLIYLIYLEVLVSFISETLLTGRSAERQKRYGNTYVARIVTSKWNKCHRPWPFGGRNPRMGEPRISVSFVLHLLWSCYQFYVHLMCYILCWTLCVLTLIFVCMICDVLSIHLKCFISVLLEFVILSFT